MIYGNGKTNWEICQYNNSLAETHFTHSHYFHSALKRFKMALMCGLWLLDNPDISRHQCNSKQQMLFNPARTDQPVLSTMYDIHGLQAMPECS